MAIITYPLNGITYDASDAETYLSTRTSGVFSGGDFDASVSGARRITIAPGLAWIRNADYKGKSVLSNGDVTVDIPMADGSLPRIDRIVLRFNASANASEIAVLAGTPAAIPEPPQLTRSTTTYELGLYTINVPAASTTVTTGQITDTRLDESVCGLMRDAVTGIPTETINSQFVELLDALRQEIEAIHAGTDQMLKGEYDPNRDGIVDHAALADVSTGTRAIATTTGSANFWSVNSETVSIAMPEGFGQSNCALISLKVRYDGAWYELMSGLDPVAEAYVFDVKYFSTSVVVTRRQIRSMGSGGVNAPQSYVATWVRY